MTLAVFLNAQCRR